MGCCAKSAGEAIHSQTANAAETAAATTRQVRVTTDTDNMSTAKDIHLLAAVSAS